MNAFAAIVQNFDLKIKNQFTFEDFLSECQECYLGEGLEHWVYGIPKLPEYVLRESKNPLDTEEYEFFSLRLPGRAVSQMVFTTGRYNICSKVQGETPLKKFNIQCELTSNILAKALSEYYFDLCNFDEMCFDDAFRLLRDMNEQRIAFDSTHHDNILIDYYNGNRIGFVDTFYVHRDNSLFHFLAPILALQFVEMHIDSQDYPFLKEPLLILFQKLERISAHYNLHHFQSCLYEGIYAEHHLLRAQLLAQILEYPLERITGKL